MNHVDHEPGLVQLHEVATTLEALHARTPLVSAVEAFEKRVLAIQEWPFDDRTMARIVGISTGVVTAIIARFVLRAFGF